MLNKIKEICEKAGQSMDLSFEVCIQEDDHNTISIKATKDGCIKAIVTIYDSINDGMFLVSAIKRGNDSRVVANSSNELLELLPELLNEI